MSPTSVPLGVSWQNAHAAIRQRITIGKREADRSTVSEVIFRHLLTLLPANPAARLRDMLKRCLCDIIDICVAINPTRLPVLNTIMTGTDCMFGSRLGRTLSQLERRDLMPCEICGTVRVHDDPQRAYRAIESASGPTTHEIWHHVPNACLFS